MSNTYSHGENETTRRLPEWLRRPVPQPGEYAHVEEVLGTLSLSTVCQSAKCPNRGECFSAGTSTFLVMGEVCTRNCRFCAVGTQRPLPLDATEPKRLAQAAKHMDLKHVVVTQVTRDDLPDGGAAHMAECIAEVKEALPAATVEVLTSDYKGDRGAIETVLAAKPTVFNHNVETVPRLYATVRPQAIYQRTLDVLAMAHEIAPHIPVKSGLMVGLGEKPEEVEAVMDDLLAHGVTYLTLGQYLRPSQLHLPVAEFVEPEQFTAYERTAYQKGFSAVASAPFVRSSYKAHTMLGNQKGGADAAPANPISH